MNISQKESYEEGQSTQMSAFLYALDPILAEIGSLLCYIQTQIQVLAS